MGLVNLACTLVSDGRLEGCEVLSELPAAKGFGGAALKLAGLYRLTLPPEGVSPGERIRLPMRIAVTPPPNSVPPGQPRRYYPEKALAREISGKATIRCWIVDDGGLTDCKVVSESPEGLGFGQSALNMSNLYRMKPDGAGLLVDVPIDFKLR